MRLSSLVCAALATIGLVFGAASSADAADPKGKKKGAGSGDSLADDRVIGKQLQWEDKVMGPDDGKGAELEKIRRAQAINKAAQEKAEREREKAEKEKAVKEAAAARQHKKSGEVALPTLPDEEPAASGKGKSKPTEISEELETTEVAPPPPPAKPADDKFIDKLLREDGGKKKKVSSAPDDKELIDILAGDNKGKPAEKKKNKKDSVDALLLEADKAPAEPAPKVKKETPEWAKPEIQSVPTPAPVAVRPPPKKEDDGVIRVVQGAAPSGRSVAVSAAPRTAPPPTPLVPASRKQAAASSSGDWDDPFAEPARKGGSAKSVPSRRARDFEEEDVAPRRATPISKREAARSSGGRAGRSSDAGWDDPFTDTDRKATPRRSPPASKPAKSTGRKAPARGGRWEDPFTAAPAPASSKAPAVAKRAGGASKGVSRLVATKRASAGKAKAKPAALAMNDGGAKERGSKWGAARRGSAELAVATPAHGARWGVLKKR